jgi:tyrocidine synthetase-3
VKIRGFRIELGEIDTRLLSHDHIDEVVVINRENERGEKYLCAYLVLKSGLETEAPGASELREYLSRYLPGYMIPSYFVPLEHIPLTPNGKMDRRALPEPELKKLEKHLTPANKVEKTLASIWSEILLLPHEVISTDANFFELGGHSLKATTLAAKTYQVFQVKLPLEEIFISPTIRGLARYIQSTEKIRCQFITVAEEKEYYPLSSMQKRLFILQQMDKTNTGYNMPAMVELEGTLDIRKVKKVFYQIIQRHESLRTAFEMIGGEPMQKISADVEFEIESPGAVIQDFIRPFDLSKAPLLRVGLLEIENQNHLLMTDMHHIISDGISIGIFLKEFTALYGEEALPAIAIHYKDFSQWHNQLATASKIKKQEEYWLREFAEEIPVLNLPLDFPRPPVQSFAGCSIHFEVNPTDTARLHRLALKEETTLYMVLLALFNIMLSKVCYQDEIVVGTAAAGRKNAELQQTIGMFVNTLAIKNSLKNDKTFKQFLEEVKQKTLAALENQDYPFEDLVEQVDVTRDTSRNPLFDVMFVLENIDLPELELEGLKLKPYEFENRIAKFDLTMTAAETTGGLHVVLEYCMKLFKESTIERFFQYFSSILRSVLDNPGIKIGTIEIISGEDKRCIIEEFNNAFTEFPINKTIHELFAEQVEKTPEKIAVVGNKDKNHITYSVLNKKASQLAYLLREKGVGLGTIAAIKVERSIELIIGLLGILKAGGAYLPIDPDYPQERSEYMLKDSNAALLLTSEELSNMGRGTKFCAPTTCNLHLSLAYIIYTSGTTGTPKGVLIRHRGFINLIQFHRKIFGEAPGSRVSQTASPGFDAMAFEVWPCLVSGASLYIANNEIRANPSRMKEWIIENGITISFQSTMMAEALLEEEWPERGAALRVLRAAGDRLKKCPQRPYPFRFYNLYGPTEDTVWTTWTEVKTKNETDTEGYPTIGKPIENHQVYILSAVLMLQPIGVAGELCIAGEGLAVGYLNNPELTSDKFISAPATSSSSNWGLRLAACGCRLYKTGDLARWLPDGNIEFLGRTDDQVKIRGYRIEPQEIQAILIHHGDIDDAIVFPVNAPLGVINEKHLCAYFIPKKELSDTELKQYLSNHLPDYMIPTYFMQIKKIPLTHNGKVDRKALPVPTIKIEGEYKAPRNEIEKKMVKIWSEILGIKTDTISINADFFQLGGHSLKATALVSRIQKEFNLDVPLIEIFKRNTIESLSEYIREIAKTTVISMSKAKDENLVLLKEGKQEGTKFFLVHAGSGEVEPYIELCARLSPEITCWGFRADRLKNYTPLNLTIETIAQKYSKKLKKLQPKGPYLIAGWCIGATIAIEMVRQLEAAGESIAFFSIINSVPPSLEGVQKVTIEFSLEPEKKWLKKILPWNELKKQLHRVKNMNTLWTTIGEYIERVELAPNAIQAFLPTNILQAIPKSAQTSAKQLVYYFNIIRSMDRARSMYIPNNKVKTKLYYLEASKSENIVKKEGWQDYCENKLEYYKVQGDHFSILQNPDVSGTAAVLKKIMMPCLQNERHDRPVKFMGNFIKSGRCLHPNDTA